MITLNTWGTSIRVFESWFNQHSQCRQMTNLEHWHSFKQSVARFLIVQVDMFNVYKCYTVHFILFPMFPMFSVVTVWSEDDILSSVSFVGTAVHAAMGDIDFPCCGGIMRSYQIVSLALGAGITSLVVQGFWTTSIYVLNGTTMEDATSVQMGSKTEMTCVGAVNLQSMLRDFHDHRYQSPSHVGYCASCLTVLQMSWRAFSSKLKVSWRPHPLCPRQPKSVTSGLWLQLWPLHRHPFGKPDSSRWKLQRIWYAAACLAWGGPSAVFGGSWSFRACGGLPRGVAVLGDRQPLRRNLAAWHTRAKGYSAQVVKPDVCRCAEIEKKHISSTTASTKTKSTSVVHSVETTSSTICADMTTRNLMTARSVGEEWSYVELVDGYLKSRIDNSCSICVMKNFDVEVTVSEAADRWTSLWKLRDDVSLVHHLFEKLTRWVGLISFP